MVTCLRTSSPKPMASCTITTPGQGPAPSGWAITAWIVPSGAGRSMVCMAPESRAVVCAVPAEPGHDKPWGPWRDRHGPHGDRVSALCARLAAARTQQPVEVDVPAHAERLGGEHARVVRVPHAVPQALRGGAPPVVGHARQGALGVGDAGGVPFGHCVVPSGALSAYSQ